MTQVKNYNDLDAETRQFLDRAYGPLEDNNQNDEPEEYSELNETNQVLHRAFGSPPRQKSKRPNVDEVLDKVMDNWGF